jgi:hypothetical protein
MVSSQGALGVIIRAKQFAVLGAQQQRLFRDRMVQRLDSSYPGRISAKYRVETRAFVDAGIAKAGRYGIELEGDIESFLGMLVEWGPDFDVAKAWAAAILNQKNHKGSDKIALLQEHERFGD